MQLGRETFETLPIFIHTTYTNHFTHEHHWGKKKKTG